MQGFVLITLVGLSAFAAEVSSSAVISPSLWKRVAPIGETQNVLVHFNQNIQSVFDKVNSKNYSSKGEKRTALTNAQQSFTNENQKPLQTFLNAQGSTHESFWISNVMVVKNADSALVQSISGIQGVAKIEEEPVVQMNLPWGSPDTVEDFGEHDRQTRQTSAEWGIKKIRADQVWGSYKGKGIVVAGIDTGVRYTHEALRGRWRTSYGWLDPYDKTSTPNDEDGHGTHTMGTIAGAGGIGVAPEATWIACKGCNEDGCTGSALLSCGQFVQCPTKPDGSAKDCSQGADVVSNSWGGSGGRTFYDNVIKSWQSAEIIPVFSQGNSGPSCNTAGYPGEHDRVIAVGSTDNNDKISSFSSLGPSTKGKVKPDVVAPGSRVRSAWYTSDTAYATLDGTSMACPHVSGLVALMLQKKSSQTYDQIYKVMTKNAVTSTLVTSNMRTCGGKSPKEYPNNVYGWGRIDAVNALNGI